MSELNNTYVSLWARLGVSLSVTMQEVEILRRQDDAAKQLLVSLVQSDRCILDGETYFPDPVNDQHLPGDVEFNFSSVPLHKEALRKPSLNDQISAIKSGGSFVHPQAKNPIRSSEPER